MKPITIVGGGLAGLSLGIGLRQAGVPVTIWESGSYPRHRVCGEFLSGRGQRILDGLGLREAILAEGGRLAWSVRFFGESAPLAEMRLRRPALCCSRFVLDALLAREFCRVGGELRERTVFPLRKARAAENGSFDEGLVLAAGRRSGGARNGARWIGLKVWGTNIDLQDDLEMHLVEEGYVGLCRLDEKTVNICGLFRRYGAESGLAEPERWREFFRGSPGSALSRRLARAKFEESSFRAIAGLDYRPFAGGGGGETTGCVIGDCASLMAPITGNGMSLAVESADLATGHLTAYSRGECHWREACALIRRRLHQQFCSRLWLGYWLQSLLFNPSLNPALTRLIRRFPGITRTLFCATR